MQNASTKKELAELLRKIDEALWVENFTVEHPAVKCVIAAKKLLNRIQ